MDKLGRLSTLTNTPEIKNLQVGLDFRKPEYRREVFLKFYEFHLKYRTNPGCVYFLFPYIANQLNFDEEARLWFAFINGNTQNPVTTYQIFTHFPVLQELDIHKMSDWFNENWTTLAWDTDRRYQKKDFIASIQSYKNQITSSQLSFFKDLFTENEYENFEIAWARIRKDFLGFGRLSTFSYTEYLRIMGLPLDCNNLFLEDMDGSASHRNGLAIVLGRDDLDFHNEKPLYPPEQLEWLKQEASLLLAEAKSRFVDRNFFQDVSYFTLESVLCTYKSWHRKNRRYPNVYADMLHDRIDWAQQHWPDEDLSIFWNARKACLPVYLRMEDSPKDPGLVRAKQNYYLETGNVIMMSKDVPEFDNPFDRSIWQ